MLGKGMYSLLTNLLQAASSKLSGLFVVPITKTSSFYCVLAPSIWMKNSVFILQRLSISPSPLQLSIESISSRNITLGCMNQATQKRVQTNHSESPSHLDTNEEAEMLKNVELSWLATALPIMVFPVPGGPKRRMPFEGSLRPWKISGLFKG